MQTTTRSRQAFLIFLPLEETFYTLPGPSHLHGWEAQLRKSRSGGRVRSAAQVVPGNALADNETLGAGTTLSCSLAISINPGDRSRSVCMAARDWHLSRLSVSGFSLTLQLPP
jgi:hypothetical protein